MRSWTTELRCSFLSCVPRTGENNVYLELAKLCCHVGGMVGLAGWHASCGLLGGWCPALYTAGHVARVLWLVAQVL